MTGGRLYGIDGTKTVTTLFEFGQSWPFDAAPPYEQVVESRGGYLAAAVAVTSKEQPNPKLVGFERVIIDQTGNILFHDVLAASHTGSIDVRVHGNDQGVFAFYAQSGTASAFDLVGAHAERYGPILDLTPISDPDESGRLCVRMAQQKHYWLDSCRETFSAVLAEQLADYTSIGVLGDKLGWVDPGAPAAVLETADGAKKLALPLDPKVGLFSTHPAGWELVLSDGSPYEFASANVTAGAVHPMNITIPSHLHRFGSFGQGVIGFDNTAGELGMSSDGAILLGLRDESVGMLYSSTDGVTWTAIGFPVGKVWSLVALERAGTFLIAGTPMGFTTDDWAPAPAGLNRVDYQQMQLVRPALGIGTVLAQATIGTGFTRGYSLSADGGCAGTLLDDKLEITSAITLEKTVIALPTFTPVYGAWTFVPGPTPSLGMN